MDFKLSLFKARKREQPASTLLEPSSIRGVLRTNEAQFTKPTLSTTSTMYSLRSSSVKLFAQGYSRSLRFFTGSEAARRPVAKRQIVHVATLTFGPFEEFTPEFASSLASNAEPLIPAAPAQDNLPDKQDDAICPDPNLDVRGAQPTGQADSTLPSAYSGGSWVNVSSGRSPRILLTSTSNLTISIGHHDSNQHSPSPQTVFPSTHPAEVTTSSINEESFLRMATDDLGW